jgi:AcrR family transcriptional regulator
MGNREKLLDAACLAFGQRGYEATSVDDLLAAAGISPSNFYYHFRSKEDLALEVLDKTFETLRGRFAPIFVNRGLGAAQKLERLHGLFVQRMRRSGCCGGCPMGNLATELSDSHPKARERIALFFEECIDGIESVVRQGAVAGEFRDDLDARAAAALLFGSLEGLMLLSKSLRSVEPLEQGFLQAVQLLRKVPTRNGSSRKAR